MSTPSLLNIPYVIKAGTLYSQIPETGAGDFAVTRATSPANNLSTRVNSLGFIERVSDNVPRLDYPLGGAVNGCASLLVEPSAQNLIRQSEDFNVSGTWNLGAGATVTPNTATSPDNTLTADTINLIALTNSRVSQSNIPILNSTTYTVSCFLKNIALVSGETFVLELYNNLASPNNFSAKGVIDLFNNTITYSQAGTSGTGISGAGSAKVENYGNGWYRYSLTFTTGSNAATTSSITRFIETADRSFYAWGFQVETGSVPTSYIPTTTQAINRGADVIRKTGITSLIGQSEGTVYFEVEVTDEARNKWFCTLDSASNSLIQMWISSTRTINVQIQNNSSVVMATLGSSALSVGYHKVAFAYNTATNGCIMYIDGVQNPVSTRTVVAPGLPSMPNMRLGGFATSFVDTLKARIRAGAVYPNRISDSDLAILTTP